ncbi:MAG: right-handed parallel beta-helix repeat-containing protein [Candidatus Micrarchaeota archaeon]
MRLSILFLLGIFLFSASSAVNISACSEGVITSPGLYTLNSSVSGAPNDAYPVVNFTCIKIASSDVVFDCDGYDIVDNGTLDQHFGIQVNGTITDSLKNITIRNCPSIANYSIGIGIYGANETNVSGVTVLNSSGSGISFTDSYGCSLTSNAVDISGGFGFTLCTDAYAENNVAVGSINLGGFFVGTTNATLINNTAHSHFGSGFTLSSSQDVSMSENIAYNNSDYGTKLYGPKNTSISYDHYYNNSKAEMRIEAYTGGSFNLTLTDVIFDNPLGNYENFTNLSLIDQVEELPSSEWYNIKWTRNESPTPSNNISFDMKFINITKGSGSPSIDSLSFRWTQDEITSGGYNEGYLGMWKYNSSGWTKLAATLDTSANALNISSLVPETIYGVLQDEPPNCIYINTSGTFTQDSNYLGHPNSGGSLPIPVCVYIEASDVVYDCNGFNITDNDSATNTGGVGLASGFKNITVKNCPSVSGYPFGIFVNGVNDSSILNSSVSDGGVGIEIVQSLNISVTGSLADNQTDYCVWILSSNQSQITNNTLWDCEGGVYLESSSDSMIQSNTLHDFWDPFGFGISMYYPQSENNTARDNRIYSANKSGIYLDGTKGHALINNTIWDSETGIRLVYSNETLIANNSISDIDWDGFSRGIDLEFGSQRNNLTGNNLTGDLVGVFIADSDWNDILHNTFSFEDEAVQNQRSSNLNISGNVIVSSSEGISNIQAGYLYIYNNSLVNISSEGILLRETENSTVTLNDVSGALALGGIHLLTASNISVSGNNVSDGQYGVYIRDSGLNTITGNGVSNCTYGMQVLDNSADNLITLNMINRDGTGISIWSFSESNNVTENNITDCTSEGILLAADGNRIIGNIISNNTQYGIDIQTADYLEVSGNNITLHQIGIFTAGTSGSNFTSNNVTQSSSNGIQAGGATSCLFRDNDVSYNTGNGIYAGSSNLNLFASNSVNNNGRAGYNLSIATLNNITDNNITFNQYGIWAQRTSDGNRFIDNNVSENTIDGMHILSSNSNFVDPSTFCDNGDNGIKLDNTSDTAIIDATLCRNGEDGIYANLSTGLIIQNATAYENGWYGIEIYNTSYSSISDSLVFSNNQLAGTSGVLVGYSTNVNVTGCIAYDNLQAGIEFDYGSHNNITNNTVHSQIDGISIRSSTDNYISRCIAYNNSGKGIGASFTASQRNLYINNTAYNNTYGFSLGELPFNNTIQDAIAYDNIHGILVSGSYNHLIGCNSSNNQEDGAWLFIANHTLIDPSTFCYNDRDGLRANYSHFIIVRDSTFCENGIISVGSGIGIYNSNDAVIENTTLSNNDNGVFLQNSSQNNITGNEAYGNDNDGFELDSSFQNTFTDNVIYGQDKNGIEIMREGSWGNLVRNNTIHDNDAGCIGIGVGAQNNTLLDNTLYNCESGIWFAYVSENNNASSNEIYDNTYGIYLYSAVSEILEGNEVHGNNDTGLYMENSTLTTAAGEHFYDNTQDVLVTTTDQTSYSFQGVIFDSPVGLYTGYTNLSVEETVAAPATLSYSFNWTDNSSSLPLPAGRTSFEQKFVDITVASGAPSLENVSWHWLDSELTDYSEEDFQIWDYDGAWGQVTATLDEDSNTISVADLSSFSDFAILEAPSIAPSDGDDENPPEEELSVSISPACEGFSINVKDAGSPVFNAFVEVYDRTNSIELAPGYTDASGHIFYGSCGIEVTVDASKSGMRGTKTALASCGVCPECETDDDCNGNEVCQDQQCVPINCPKGEAVDHACVIYECVDDSDCGEGQVCLGHECRPAYECYSDDGCASSERCVIPQGQDGGSCEDVGCECGMISNHACERYQCCSDRDCLAGMVCKDHRCVQADVRCPEEGIVGDEKQCNATENGDKCSNCDYRITAPDGKNYTGKTDENGNFVLPLRLQGDYQVTLLKDGQVIRVVTVQSLPKPGTGGEEKPTAWLPQEAQALFLVVLVALLFLALLYLRRRGERREEKGAEQKI